MTAALVRVERPGEWHPPHAVERAAAADLVVARPGHAGLPQAAPAAIIERPFWPRKRGGAIVTGRGLARRWARGAVRGGWRRRRAGPRRPARPARPAG